MIVQVNIMATPNSVPGCADRFCEAQSSKLKAQKSFQTSGDKNAAPNAPASASWPALVWRLSRGAFLELCALSFVLRLHRALILALLLSPALLDDTTNSVEQLAVLRAKHAFAETRQRYQRETNSAEAAWQFGRACFQWAEFATNNPQRAEIAYHGIAACRRAAAQSNQLAAAQYYLSLNLGQLARTKRFSALHLLDEMETAFLATIALDPAFNYAGAYRSLGLLYQEAPGWPISLGSRGKARTHLEKSVQLSSDYPDNHLCLLEAYLQWGDTKKARSNLTNVESILQTARAKLTGDDWALSWQDWDGRWKKIKSAVPVGLAASPKQKK